jgi:hypothetical protein
MDLIKDIKDSTTRHNGYLGMLEKIQHLQDKYEMAINQIYACTNRVTRICFEVMDKQSILRDDPRFKMCEILIQNFFILKGFLY